MANHHTQSDASRLLRLPADSPYARAKSKNTEEEQSKGDTKINPRRHAHLQDPTFLPFQNARSVRPHPPSTHPARSHRRQHPHILMDCSNGEVQHKWIEDVKSGGAVPFLDPDNCPNGWATPPGDTFMVRGPEYLTTKVKIPGGEYLLKPLGFDWVKSTSKISEVLKNKNHRVRKAIDSEVSSGNQPFVWAFNLQLPSKDNYSAIFYFLSLEPVQEGSLMDQFLKGDETFRKSRLKLIANIVKGPWIVRTAVGEQAICILGRALSCKYIQGSNFIEIDVDVGSSIVANAIVHLAFGYVQTLTVDLAFLIEGQTESELPERLLAAVRFSELNPGSAGVYEVPSEEQQENASFLPARLWQGFSHLLHNPGNSREPSSSSQSTNGSLHKEDAVNDAAVGLHKEDVDDNTTGSLLKEDGYESATGSFDKEDTEENTNGSLHKGDADENTKWWCVLVVIASIENLSLNLLDFLARNLLLLLLSQSRAAAAANPSSSWCRREGRFRDGRLPRSAADADMQQRSTFSSAAALPPSPISPADGFLCVKDGVDEMIKYVANEPSVGLYFVQQHAQASMPLLLDVKGKVTEKIHEVTLHTEDIEDSICAVRSMAEFGLPIADDMIKDINKSLKIISKTQPKRGLIQNPSWGFQSAKSSGTWEDLGTTNGGSSRNYFSSMFNTAKQKASTLRWPQPDFGTKDDNSEESVSSTAPGSSQAGAHCASTPSDAEKDDLPVSSQLDNNTAPMNESFSSIGISKSVENYNKFKEEQELKLQEWLRQSEEADDNKE
uniref:Protein ENHANCED DISEASE RESISTANCE 2 C-terminal domain-containing protein n=1 Tax=Leersia perrieri TaxID=77586 RepID=A0A0D9X4G7_9ORYZ